MNPAKIASVCFIFLLVLYVTSGVDLAIAVSFVAIIVLYKRPSVWLFLGAFSSFSLYLVMSFLSIKIAFVSDLSISSYLLFAGGIALYFFQGQKKEWVLTLPLVQRIRISHIQLIRFGVVLLFAFLIYPLTDAYITIIVGYILFIYFFRKFDGRFAFGVALFFLALCPFLLISKKEKVAEVAATITYYFLTIGTVQELILFLKNPREKEEDSYPEQVESPPTILRSERVKELRHAMNLKSNVDFPLGKQVKKLSGKIFIAMSALSMILVLIFFFSTKRIVKLGGKQNISPTPTLSFTPTPTVSLEELKEKTATLASTLRVRVENGTEIQGLAGTAAGLLKEYGFKNVSAGNARRKDYTTWEVRFKQDNELLTDYIRQVLDVPNLQVSYESSPSANIDILIIAGVER